MMVTKIDTSDDIVIKWEGDYSAYGMLLTGDIENLWLPLKTYALHEHDIVSGLVYAQARWYDPKTGQFISEDPIKDGNNYYSYCGGNPIGMVDPTGLYGLHNPSGVGFGDPDQYYKDLQYGGYNAEQGIYDYSKYKAGITQWQEGAATSHGNSFSLTNMVSSSTYGGDPRWSGDNATAENFDRYSDYLSHGSSSGSAKYDQRMENAMFMVGAYYGDPRWSSYFGGRGAGNGSSPFDSVPTYIPESIYENGIKLYDSGIFKAAKNQGADIGATIDGYCFYATLFAGYSLMYFSKYNQFPSFEDAYKARVAVEDSKMNLINTETGFVNNPFGVVDVFNNILKIETTFGKISPNISLIHCIRENKNTLPLDFSTSFDVNGGLKYAYIQFKHGKIEHFSPYLGNNKVYDVYDDRIEEIKGKILSYRYFFFK